MKDVATKSFSLPKETRLDKVLHEMMRHWLRRVFLSGTGRYVSDREILGYIFSPERLAIIKESPLKMLEAELEDIQSVEPIPVDSDVTIEEVSELFRPSSGDWCLQCDLGIITPWDLVMKPWKMECLTVSDAIERAPKQRWKVVEGTSDMISFREFLEELKKNGYSIEFDAKVKGTSGQIHRVDGLAIQGNGEKSKVWLEKRRDSIVEIIETFAISYDTGAEPYYVADGELSENERKLAENYKLRLLSKGN